MKSWLVKRKIDEIDDDESMDIEKSEIELNVDKVLREQMVAKHEHSAAKIATDGLTGSRVGKSGGVETKKLEREREASSESGYKDWRTP